MTKLEKLKKRFPGIREHEPLKNHCTFRVGGPADFFYELVNIEELPDIVVLAEESALPYRVIGRGTNVLFTDKGFRGLIIKNLSRGLEIIDPRFRGNDIEKHGDDNTIIVADSGVLLIQIIRKAIENGLVGLEPLYGLPGSIGGAVCGNAGIPGTEIGAFVERVTLFNPADGVREVTTSEIQFRYRATSLQTSGDLVIKVQLRLPKGNSEESKAFLKKIDEVRRGKQPTGFSAGSFFKNPSKEKPAGYLIDQTGLKGARIGDAEISMKHANFFMNRGNATAAEILELSALAQQKVKEKFGVELEMEVKIIGDL